MIRAKAPAEDLHRNEFESTGTSGVRRLPAIFHSCNRKFAPFLLLPSFLPPTPQNQQSDLEFYSVSLKFMRINRRLSLERTRRLGCFVVCSSVRKSSGLSPFPESSNFSTFPFSVDYLITCFRLRFKFKADTRHNDRRRRRRMHCQCAVSVVASST